MRFSRFIAIDGTAAMVTTSIFVWLGYHFAADLAGIIPWVERYRTVALVAVVVLTGVVIHHTVMYRLERRRLMKADEE